MKIKQTLKTLIVGGMLLFGVAVATVSVTPATTFAVCETSAANCCGGVETSIISCPQEGGENAAVDQTGVWGLLLLAINILTALIGLAAVAGLIYGAILYTTAAGSPEQVKKAIGIITNVVIGVVAYALMFAGLNFLIPGGVFNL